MSKDQIVKKDDIVVRFAGDSGDGMQLSGTLFSDASALTGNDIATSPTILPKFVLRTIPLRAFLVIRCMWVTTFTARATSATYWSP